MAAAHRIVDRRDTPQPARPGAPPPPRAGRRGFLAATAALALGSAATHFGLGSIAHAQARGGGAAVDRRRRFIFCYFAGGWDQLLLFDTRDPAVFTEARRDETRIDTRFDEIGRFGYGAAPLRAGDLVFGPAAWKPEDEAANRHLGKHHDRIALVRGIDMATVAHVGAYRYFLTGTFPSGEVARGTNMSVALAALSESDAPLPVVHIGVEGYNDRYASRYSPFGIGGVADLNPVLERSGALAERAEVEQALARYGARTAPCEVDAYDRRGLFGVVRESSARAQELLAARLDRRLAFPAAPPGAGPDDPIAARNARLRALYGVDNADTGSPALRAAVAGLLVKEGIAQCVSVVLTNGVLDTHVNNFNQGALLAQPIAALATLIDDLATAPAPPELGGSWLDHTTVVAFSEFARTPLHNQLGGRDHHLYSSILMAGGAIQGGQVVGATSDVGMTPVPYDFGMGQTDVLRPAHVTATLLASAGLDYSLTRVSPIGALLPSR